MVTTASLADLLEELVRIPSVTGNEDEIATFVARRLAGVGRGEILRSGKSVVWRGPQRDRPLVVLAGHTDTVPPSGNAVPRRDGDNLYGVGTSDMKAGDAVMLALVESLDPARLRFDLAAVFYDAEEGPAENNGLGRLLDEMPWLRQARLAILLEPTNLQTELGCNGTLHMEVRVPGKAAHSARPWLGVNAVERAAPWLAEITKVPVRPVNIHGIEYRETLQVTTVRAGKTRNVVPDELVANLNYRFTPDVELAAAEAKLLAMVPKEFEAKIVDRAAAGRVSLDLPEVKDFVAQTGAKLAGKQGWTDVARFSAAGVAAFNFGPGLAEMCHQADEYCPIPNLETAYRWLARYLGTETS